MFKTGDYLTDFAVDTHFSASGVVALESHYFSLHTSNFHAK
jgi:hypothetical protein